MTNAVSSQALLLTASVGQKGAQATNLIGLVSYGPAASREAEATNSFVFFAHSGGTTNVTTEVTEVFELIAYSSNQPGIARQAAWSFILDGHRMYVLPLGKEGDWAYDTTTREWCKLQTAGFDGMNFTHGTMWGVRIVGGDSLYPYVLELDPTQPLDEGWRPITRVVTGGIPTRSRAGVSVANFSLVASVNQNAEPGETISLAFSDDNGATYSQEFPIPLTDKSSQVLIWNALGSFALPGRLFRITDTAGPVRIDGADVVLTSDPSADSGLDQQ